jgi:uncharacterized protein (TIGR02231 family)
MKKIVWILCFTAISSWALNAAAEEGASQITDVTVFRDRASVRRVRKLSLKRGASSIVFRGLTPLLDLESLKATISEKKQLTLMGIRTQNDFTVSSSNSDLEKWIAARKRSETRRQEIFNQVNLLVQSNQNLELLAQHYRDSFSLNLHQNSWTKAGFESFVKFLSSQSEVLNGNWAKLYESYHRVTKELEFAEAKTRELTSVSDRHTVAVSVDLLADAAATVEVELQYLVPECGWSPAYDVRVHASDAKASIEQHAFIWQRSGEDWKDVSLTLSNVREELRPEPPSISPYTLSYREVKKVQTTITSGADSASSLTVGSSPGEPTTDAEDKGLARNFKVPGVHSVRDGMARTRVFLNRKDAVYSESLELVAAEYGRVFRKGETQNPFDWDLEGGPASVYYGGNFMQQITLERVAKGNRFGINAGVDHDFQVSRWTNDKVENPGIIDTKKHFLREVGISLTNYGGRRKAVRIYEQVPVSEIKEVAVATGKTSPGLQKDMKNPGWNYWDVTLAPKERQVVTLNLDVAVPSAFAFSW